MPDAAAASRPIGATRRHWLTHVNVEITARRIADLHGSGSCRSMLNVRRELTDSRTRAILIARADHPRRGIRIRSGAHRDLSRPARRAGASGVHDRDALPVAAASSRCSTTRSPGPTTICDARRRRPRRGRLMTLPSIGPITASAFIAALDDAARFERRGAGDQLSGPRPARVQLRRAPQRGRICAARIRTCNRCWFKRPGA